MTKIAQKIDFIKAIIKNKKKNYSANALIFWYFKRKYVNLELKKEK